VGSWGSRRRECREGENDRVVGDELARPLAVAPPLTLSENQVGVLAYQGGGAARSRFELPLKLLDGAEKRRQEPYSALASKNGF
jgi:hypothetical protein